MCSSHQISPRPGSRLEDGSDHDEDHAGWSRRQFLTGMGLAAASTALAVSGTPVRAFARSPLLAGLRAGPSDRVLVLIQLAGGNDGLNTIIPVSNDIYYNQRPTLSIPQNQTITLSVDTGMHPSLLPLESRFGEGQMAVIHGVGYPSPVLSHFRSTDVWISGNEASNISETGWTGRYLDTIVPDFRENPPSKPLAVQIGSGSPTLFQGPDASMGMSLLSVDLFERIAGTGVVYDTESVNPGIQGNEIAFVRSVANESFQYAGAIQDAANSGVNEVTYPSNNSLAAHLAIVASLIKGGLGAKIYHVSIGGFDTHANQLATHATLMDKLSSAVSSFMSDIEAAGRQDEVLTMTFSEFGRRVEENGSGGCDHGTAAPLLLFGAGLNGGIYGQQPSLEMLDTADNMIFQTDFRAVYSTILQDWFGLLPGDSDALFGQHFNTIGFVESPIVTGTESSPVPDRFVLHQNYPNPFNPRTTLTFTLHQAGAVQLELFDMTGRRIRVLMDRILAAGTHAVTFDAGNLSSGNYLYQIRSGTEVQSRQMTVLR